MGYRVTIDKDVCISSGKCVADYPAAFVFDADEIAEPTGDADRLSDEELLAAARNCPSGAIRLHDARGAEVAIW